MEFRSGDNVIAGAMSSIGQQRSKTLNCWTCWLLVAMTTRSGDQNFYEERMEVSRRNWSPRGLASRFPEAAASNKPKSLTINDCRRGAAQKLRAEGTPIPLSSHLTRE